MGVTALNLGCGTTTSPNYINYDNSPNLLLSRVPGARGILCKLGIIKKAHLAVQWPAEVKYLQIHKGLPHKENTVDYVYTSHFLEHTEKSACEFILRSAYKCLKPNGTIRIVLPDLRFYINKYLEAKKDNKNNAADMFLEEIWIKHARDPHLWMYDYESMHNLLQKIGFVNITKQTFKKGKCLDIDILDNRPEDSFFIEADK